MISNRQKALFTEVVWEYYQTHGRHDLPWRQPEADGSFDSYKIMLSEIMLQQTQVARVMPKFKVFLQEFPTVQALAAAPLAAVLVAWNGLGYNRRAKFLWQAAQAIITQYDGSMPRTVAELKTLPGIGANTAGAIAVYAYNQPVVFIETNIRTVFIHHFFGDSAELVADATLAQIVAETLDAERPREWYWALMDYGVHLKQTVGNVSQRSKSYAKQSAFKGSLRQVRGAVIRELAQGALTKLQLQRLVQDKRLDVVLANLEREQLIEKRDNSYHLANS